MKEAVHGGAKRRKQRAMLKRSRECVDEPLAHVSREIVEGAPVKRRETTTTTGEAERIISSAANPILSLPVAASFDADASPHGMMNGVTKELLCRRRLKVRFLNGGPREQLELRDAGVNERSNCRQPGSKKTL